MLTRCCCMRLNTFGVVLGWLGIVGSLIGVIVTSVCLSKAREIAESIVKNTDSKNVDIDALTTWIVIICSIYLVFCLIGLLSSALLVVGIVKERHLLMLPWLINSIIGFVFNTIYELIAISGGGTGGALVGAIIIAILAFVLQFYIIYAVYSLYKQIQANRDQQSPLIRPPGASGNYPSYTQI